MVPRSCLVLLVGLIAAASCQQPPEAAEPEQRTTNRHQQKEVENKLGGGEYQPGDPGYKQGGPSYTQAIPVLPQKATARPQKVPASQQGAPGPQQQSFLSMLFPEDSRKQFSNLVALLRPKFQRVLSVTMANTAQAVTGAIATTFSNGFRPLQITFAPLRKTSTSGFTLGGLDGKPLVHVVEAQPPEQHKTKPVGSSDPFRERPHPTLPRNR